MPSQFPRLLNGLSCHGVCLSSMKEDVFHFGRPFGGVAVVWKSTLAARISNLALSCSEICSIVFDVCDLKLAIFSLYMPCDGGDHEKYKDMLCEVRSACISRNIDYFLVCGDLNTDLSRVNSLHTESLLSFVNEESLNVCLYHPIANIDYTYESRINGSRSTLDHFLVSENLTSYINAYFVEHSVDNSSDHSPVTLELKLSIGYSAARSDRSGIVRYNWKQASTFQINDYKACLDNMLSIKYKEDGDVNDRYEAIVSSCLSATSGCIPKIYCRKKRIVSWNVEVSKKRATAIFWHRLWLDNDRPANGQVFEIRKKTRREYHTAVKAMFKKQEVLNATSVAQSLAENDNTGFWQKIKRFNHSSKLPVATVIDGVSGAREIAEIFTKNYEKLYSTVGYSSTWKSAYEDKLKQSIENRCRCSLGSCSFCHNVLPRDVAKHARELKPEKSDVVSCFTSDCLIHGSPRLFQCLANLFSSMLNTGDVPVSMGLSTIVPIPKNNRKSLYDSSNYRSIAISSVVLKIFEKFVLLHCSNELQTSDLQFGFKSGHSTTQCTFTLQEAVSYYTSRNSTAYVMLLDCTKAFDRVSYENLFDELFDRNICPLLLNMIWQLYKNNVLQVKWENTIGRKFNMVNGVKQGGILSPKFFTVYIDALFTDLEKSGFGCFLNDCYYGALGYADDIALIAGSKSDLQHMLDICTTFAASKSLLFNPNKSAFLVFSSRVRNESILFDGVALKSVQSASHLGHIIEAPNFSVNFKNVLSNYAVKVNSICSTFQNLPFDVTVKLCWSICYCLYGCELWKLSKASLDLINVVWRKSMRKLLDIPYRTHCVYIPFLVENLGLEGVVCQRAVGFYQKCIASKNQKVSYAALIASVSSRSAFSEKLLFICQKLNCDTNYLLSFSKHDVKIKLQSLFFAKLNVDEILPKVNFILEILDERDHNLGHLSKSECKLILSMLCCD